MCAQVSNWSSDDQVSILQAKLCGDALQLVEGREGFSGQAAYETFFFYYCHFTIYSLYINRVISKRGEWM
jgi:hypothetical protein